MAIKVRWDADGPFAICDTTAEAMEMMKHGHSSANGTDQRSSREQSGEPEGMGDKIAADSQEINDKAKKLLRAIANHPQGMEAGEDLAKECGIDINGFGGTLGAVSKYAKKVGITIDRLVQSESRLDGMRKYRWFAPTKLLLEHKNRLQ